MIKGGWYFFESVKALSELVNVHISQAATMILGNDFKQQKQNSEVFVFAGNRLMVSVFNM